MLECEPAEGGQSQSKNGSGTMGEARAIASASKAGQRTTMNLRLLRSILLLAACSVLRFSAANSPPTAITTYDRIGLDWSAPEAKECAV